MVIRMGDNKREVTHSLSQLVRDFRLIMQPYTASKLRERKSNRLKDFVVMAGPLGVSHLMIFSQSINGNTSLRIARTPRGPTLNFRVKSYSLCKDIQKFTKNPRSTDLASTDYANPPLLVMNGFSTDKSSDKDALLTSMLQNMFPPINVQDTKIGSIKRVMMINKDPDSGYLDIRHYAIDTKLVDVSRPVKKLSTVKTHLHKKLPNMSRASDIADYLLDPSGGGYTSESEVEDDATVEIARNDEISGKNEGSKSSATATNTAADKPQTQKRAVKLVEIGPRLRLELRKIEDGLCEGKTLYHSYVEKTPAQIKKLEKRHNERQELKEKRRKEQEENVRRKQELKVGKTSRTKRGLEKAKVLENGGEDADNEEDAKEDVTSKNPEEMDDYDLEIADAVDSDEDDE